MTEDIQKNEFLLDVMVFLEGVQIPVSSASVSYGINQPCMCTIVMPASNVIRDLPECTKVHVFFRDMIHDNEYRLLFDGELAQYSYNVDATGASMSISAVHCSGYMDLMQILVLNAEEFMFVNNPHIAGESSIPVIMGEDYVKIRLIDEILKQKVMNNMADIVYRLIGTLLSTTKESSSTEFYSKKIKEWKILDRIYGVSDVAKSTPFPEIKKKTEEKVEVKEVSADGGGASDVYTP